MTEAERQSRISSAFGAVAQLLSAYGMVVVLVLLCVVLSFITYDTQAPTGAAAGEQVGAAILKNHGDSPRILLVIRNVPEERAYAAAVHRTLRQGKPIDFRVYEAPAMVMGEPRDARLAMEEMVARRKLPDAIVTSSATASWLVLTERGNISPALADIPVYQPVPYRWPTFLKPDNLLNIANQIAVIAIVAIGMTVVIVTGGIDLSVGSLIALSAVVAALGIRDYAGGYQASVAGMVAACAFAMALCAGVGGLSGGMITFLRLPPFIVTLAMLLVASGLAYTLAESQSVYQLPESFLWLGRGADLFGIPNAVVLTLLLYLAAHVLMSRTVLGRHIYAVGGNPKAAWLSGVPTHRVIIFAYACSGLLAGLGGVVMSSLYRSGSPTYGAMYEMYTIAAVVVGGTSLSGGEGRVFNTLIGALLIAVIQNGMNLTNIESNMQRIVLGGVILAAVITDTLRKRWLPRRAGE
jgi:ribose transport system permease protein